MYLFINVYDHLTARRHGAVQLFACWGIVLLLLASGTLSAYACIQARATE